LHENGDPKIEVSLEVKAGPILDQPIEPQANLDSTRVAAGHRRQGHSPEG
jgi:hypothetical protein